MDFYDSNVYKTLLCNYPAMTIVVYDNSPIAHKVCNDNIIYYHDESNGGVSAGYNYGAEMAKMYDSFSALLLLDQDTSFSADYIQKLEKAIEELPNIGLFVPMVFYNKNKVFSPYKRGILVRKNIVLDEGLHSLLKYMPVNSGACVRLGTFEKVGGYSRSIMLDFADIDFFSRMCEVTDKFYLIKSDSHQNFSNDETDYNKLKKRFELFLKSGNAAKENPMIKKWVHFTMFKHSIALSFRTRKLFFIHHFFKGI